MEKLELLMNAATMISDDKIIDAVAFAVKANSVSRNVVFALFVPTILYFVYRIDKFIARDIERWR